MAALGGCCAGQGRGHSITVGLKKPVAAVLICALLIGQPAWGPLIVGATIGLAVTGLRRTTTDD